MSAQAILHDVGESWWRWTCGAALDGAVGIAAALLLWLLLRRQVSARFGCGLFMLVLVKMAVPLPVSFSIWRPEALPARTESAPLGFSAAFADDPAALLPDEGVALAKSGLLWRQALLLGWAVIVIAGLALLTWRLARTRRLVHVASPCGDERLSKMIAALARSAGFQREVRVLESPRLASPAAWGFGVPRILLPDGLSSRLTDAQLRWTLAHELAHLRRHDAWWSLLQSVLLLLFFWHPAAWIARRMIDRQREEACDAEASELSQAQPREAADGLVAIAEWAALRPAHSFAMPGMAARKPHIHHRIMKIASHHRIEPRGRVRVLIGASVAALAILPSVRPDWSRAAENEKVKQLEKRVVELEGDKSRESKLADLRAKNKTRANERARQDNKTYSREQLQEIETLYQVANKNWRTPEAKDSLKKLLEKYDNANRTGCATLYMGQMSEGADRAEYLKRAVEKFSDCFYFNGCQVGGYARYILGAEAFIAGRKDEAEKLFAEIRKDYAEAIMHNGTPVTEAVEKFLASQAEKK